MAGVTPGRAPVYTALKTHPVKPRRRTATAETSAVICTSGLHDLDGHVTVQIHLPLLTATLVLQLEPGIVVVVWAKIVIAGDPVIEHANTPNDERVLDVIDGVFSLHRHNAVPCRTTSTTRRETFTTTRHRKATRNLA